MWNFLTKIEKKLEAKQEQLKQQVLEDTIFGKEISPNKKSNYDIKENCYHTF